MDTIPNISFNSLQTGKGMASLMKMQFDFETRQRLFQFPSNGKGYRKPTGIQVQIVGRMSFNSLQTGKGIARRSSCCSNSTRSRVSIPFKRERGSQVFSIGSHYTKSVTSFNSLQTGKGIASQSTTCLTRFMTCGSFNSLQTGKGIARMDRA